MRARSGSRNRPSCWALCSVMRGLLVLGLLLASAPPDSQAAEKLVALDPTRLDRTDHQGLAWDPQVDGMLRDGSHDCFDGALELKVNGSTFTPNISRKMTPDASELVLRGSVTGLQITRRIRFDLQRGAARYVEVLQNKTGRPATVQLSVSSALGLQAGEILTNTEAAFGGGRLEDGAIGVVASRRGGDRPSVLFVLSTPGSTAEPTIQIQGRRRFVFLWNLKLAAGQTLAVLHTVVQRRWDARPSGEALQTLFAPFLERRWAEGLPRHVGKALVNFRGSGPHSTHVSATAAADDLLRALAKRYEVRRDDEAAFLFLKPGAPLMGSLEQDEGQDQKLEIETAYGKVDLELQEVAVLLGGGNRGRTMRLYLRNGEVLVGSISAPPLRLRTPAGLTLPLDPAGIDALFLPVHESDGAAPPGTESYLSFFGGTRLALAAAHDLTLHAATAWGELRIPFARVVGVQQQRGPRPSLRLQLDDGSSFPIALVDGPLRVESSRFGPLVVPPGSLAGWGRHGASQPPLTRYGKGVGPLSTHACLPGKTYVVGTVALETFRLAGPTGTFSLPVAQLKHAARKSPDTEEETVFVWSLRNGKMVSGSLVDALLPMQTPYGLCHLPTRHLVGIRIEPDPSEKGD